jgi:hypothetical protein
MGQFQIRLRRRNIPGEDLLTDLRKTANFLGRSTVTALQYDEHGEFGSTTILRRFGTWNQALGLAELSVSNRQNIGSEELFENIALVWTSIGAQPLGRQMSDKSTGSSFSLGTYEKRFGSWNKALLAFAQFINGGATEVPLAFARDIQPRSTKFKRTPRTANWRLRAKVLLRDNCICRMCGASPAKNPATVLHVDHIVAWVKGGETVEENLQTLCDKCNIGKSDMESPLQ